jgi:hypothetical protein
MLDRCLQRYPSEVISMIKRRAATADVDLHSKRISRTFGAAIDEFALRWRNDRQRDRQRVPACAKPIACRGYRSTGRCCVVRVRSTQPPRCPACSSVRVSYHSRYDRRLRDLPWQGRQVQLRFRTRRFRCRNGACRRKIFAERLPGVAAARARESRRLGEVLGRVGYALGGLPGDRLLGTSGLRAVPIRCCVE